MLPEPIFDNLELKAYPANDIRPRSEADYILVADDDPDARMILCSLLKMLGWESVAVNNGEEVLKQIEARMPTLIVLDLMMPVMNGFEVLGHLKANLTTRDIPLIIISALGTDQRLARLGASVVIQKGSVTIARLHDTIKEALSLVSGQDAASSGGPT